MEIFLPHGILGGDETAGLDGKDRAFRLKSVTILFWRETGMTKIPLC